jgi:hypothetical protein
MSAGAVLMCKPLTQGPAPVALSRARRYSRNVGEEEFYELRLYRVLGSVPSLVAVQRAITRINLERE